MGFKLLGGVKSYGLGFDSTAYLTGNVFELYPVKQVAVTGPGGGLEGAIPLAPGQVQNLYQPVSMGAPYLVPWRKEFKPTNIHHVGIKIKFQDDETFASERYFLIHEPTQSFTIEVSQIKPRPIIVFKPTTERIGIAPSVPRATLKLQKRIKIEKLPSNGDK